MLLVVLVYNTLQADEECIQTHKKPFAMDECARFLNKAFTACIQHK